MKRIPLFLSLVLFLSTVGFAQQKKMDQKRQQMMEMMQDSTIRNMMMEHMAQNPQMRQQMMQSMMQNMTMDSTAMVNRMQKMMNNPQMKQRMQQHMEMMQSMMKGGHMRHGRMMGEMGDASMMKKHMTCMELMDQNETDMDSEQQQ